MRRMKKVNAIILSIAMVCIAMPVQAENSNMPEIVEAGDFAVTGDTAYTYENGILTVNSDGEYSISMKEGVETTDNVIKVENGVTARITLMNVSVENEYTSPITIDKATVELVLPKDTKNVCSSSSAIPAGIAVPKGAKLTISGEGTLDVSSNGGAAGIGGCVLYGEDCGEIIINGGTISAKALLGAGIGGNCEGGNGGLLTINGGSVTAESSHGAGIGGGYCSDNDGGSAGTIIVNDGTIVAKGNAGGGITGSHSECGIGGAGPIMTINGGNIIASSINAAAIGGGISDKGNGGKGGSITVNGGSVTASTICATAIGGGVSCEKEGGSGGTLTINGGMVTAFCDGVGAAVGGGLSNALGDNVELQFGEDAVVKVNPMENTQIKVLSGKNEGTATFIQNSPFTSETDISELIFGKLYFGAITENQKEQETDTTVESDTIVEVDTEVTTETESETETVSIEKETKNVEAIEECTTATTVEKTTVQKEVSAPRAVKLKKLKLKKKKLTAKWQKVKGVKGYEIQFALNKKFTKHLKKKIVYKTSFTMKKLKKGKKYFVRVRAFVVDSKGKKTPGKWSKIKKKKVK